MLLHKEVKLLQTIDRLKGEAQKVQNIPKNTSKTSFKPFFIFMLWYFCGKVNKDQKIKQELDAMSAPKVLITKKN